MTVADAHLLDNIFWHALTGPQAHFAAGGRTARRYAAGFSPIVGFQDPVQPDFDALAPLCAEGESFYCDGWSGPMPAGWRLDAEARMFKMIWTAAAPPPSEDLPPGTRTLGAADLDQVLGLVALTRPGPFGPRTIELGEYIGCFDDAAGGQLVAMAGERSQAGRLREISGVCTHPEHQGRGLARRLMLALVARAVDRGETPVLHVMQANEGAHRLYLKMGFADHRLSPVRVISRDGATQRGGMT